MKMCELFSFLDPSEGAEVTDLITDTRKAHKGAVFFLLPRAEKNLVDFYNQTRGRVLKFIHSVEDHKDKGHFVENAEEIYFRALKRFYAESVSKLKIYGITGTNGKTTTAFMLHSLLEDYGVPTGLYGTVKNAFSQYELDTGLTSPAAEDFYRFNHQNFKRGMRVVVCEVSSHALDQRRLSTEFLEGAAFTSFSQDHLDYHQTMDAYFEAKLKIKSEALKKEGFFVLSKDVKAHVEQHVEKKTAIQLGENYDFKVLSRGAFGFELQFRKGERSIEGTLPLFGDYNASNFAVALTMLCEHFGEDFFPDQRVFKNFKQIPGRMEKVDLGKGSFAFIDYSHTPDSLEKALKTLKKYSDGQRVISIFGCGGDRDRSKRKLMGKVSELNADLTIVTSDNPRSEDPIKIIEDVLEGVDQKSFIVEPDRARAIYRALKFAQENPSCVLIAGKGHEKTQEVQGVKKDFSDLAEVLKFKVRN